MTERLLLDVREVAALLGCGRTLVYGMIQRGELPVVKLGRLTRIPVSALADFVSRQALVRDEDLAWSVSDADLERARSRGAARIGDGGVAGASSRNRGADQRGDGA